ncbi:ABC transporter substrate-binding protein [Methylobacterium crusticola]|nr:ABC transporter substrate-binding protein [Methylobacterium crusticola]
MVLITGAVPVPGLSTARAEEATTLRVGWTIPAEEAKYWMMRRPAAFPGLGTRYTIEWVQFQGTAPMTQALAAGALDCATQSPLALAQGAVEGGLKADIVAQHVSEKPGSFSVYWAVRKDSPIRTPADLKGKTVGINTLGSGIYGPMALLLRRSGLDASRDIKLVEIAFPLSEDAIRSGRVDAAVMNQPFAARAEARGDIRRLFALSEQQPDIVHILEACRKDFVARNPNLVRTYVRALTAGMRMALADRPETLKVVSEVMKAPVAVLDTYLLKDNDFARDPGARPDFAAIQRMYDTYAETGLLPRRLDAEEFHDPAVTAPIE